MALPQATTPSYMIRQQQRGCHKFIDPVSYLAQIVFVLILLIIAREARADAIGCEKVNSPRSGDYYAAKPLSSQRGESIWPTNQGPVVHGFVNIPGENLVQGFDVSKYQPNTDFTRAKDCGAEFVYVRFSSGDKSVDEQYYRFHWRDARFAGLMVGPYHNLATDDFDNGIRAATVSQEVFQKQLKHDVAYAHRQADLFVGRLNEMVGKDPTSKKNGSSTGYLPMVLDVSWRPQKNGLLVDRNAFGEIYRAEICAWLGVVNSNPAFARQTKILFTFPDIYHDYQLSRAQCGIDKMSVWVSEKDTKRDGSKFGVSGAVQPNTDLAELCGVGPKSRCIMQHYTSFGDFGIYPVSVEAGSGLSLDRFFGTRDELRSLLQQVSE